jgi:hypothetical protein
LGHEDSLEQPLTKTIEAVSDPQVQQNIAERISKGNATILEKGENPLLHQAKKNQGDTTPPLPLSRKSLLTLAKLVQTLKVQQKERGNDPQPAPKPIHLGKSNPRPTKTTVSTADPTHQSISDSHQTSQTKRGEQ